MDVNHKYLYQLIISQLRDDGFVSAAAAVSSSTMIPPPTDIPKNRLQQLVQFGLSLTKESDLVTERDTEFSQDGGSDFQGIDFEKDLMKRAIAPNFTTRFITTHKESCRMAKFSKDGKFVATGSEDTSIKLLDVDKMKNFNQQKTDLNDKYSPARPVIRTYYDNNGPINDIDFHPTQSMLCSASSDKTIKFYDYKGSVKRSCRSIQETHIVRSINFHPTGDYLLCATDQCLIRLYDLNTGQAYTCSNTLDHHYNAINMVHFSPDGSLFVSGSKDGCIKIWDAINFKCIKYIPNAHSGNEINSVRFSKNGKYILSAGKDSTVRLWDLHLGEQIKVYSGHKNRTNSLNAEFNWNEDYVFGLDESAHICMVWDTRNTEITQRLSGHNGLIRWVAASPTEPSLMTCSDDHRARFWFMDPPSRLG